MFLGTCPTLATTNSLTNAVGMSVAFAVVLMMTNTIIAAIRKNSFRIEIRNTGIYSSNSNSGKTL